jgi:O-acetyl-ADP-ribose deacetylase (regulator of RNase III)
VGPVWRDGAHNEEKMLRSAVLSALQLADRLKLRSVSFPSISTGIFGFPLKPAIAMITETIFDFLKCNNSVEEVHLCEISEEKSLEIKNVIENLPE